MNYQGVRKHKHWNPCKSNVAPVKVNITPVRTEVHIFTLDLNTASKYNDTIKHMDPLEGFYTIPTKTKNDFGAITKHKNEPTSASHLKAFFFFFKSNLVFIVVFAKQTQGNLLKP